MTSPDVAKMPIRRTVRRCPGPDVDRFAWPVVLGRLKQFFPEFDEGPHSRSWLLAKSSAVRVIGAKSLINASTVSPGVYAEASRLWGSQNKSIDVSTICAYTERAWVSSGTRRAKPES